MGYQIEAYIDDGKPSLKIWDIKHHSLCLDWTYSNSEIADSEVLQKEVHQLFRQLLLLTLKDDVSNVRVFQVSPKQMDS